MKTFFPHGLMTWRLPTLWWAVACLFFVAQGFATATIPPCASAISQSGMAASMPGMTADAVLPAAADSPLAGEGCEHCQSHRQNQGCTELHSCTAPLATAMPVGVITRIQPDREALLPTVLPRIRNLAFDPPLRPPPA